MDWEQFETQLKQDQSAVEAALHVQFQDSARYADLTEAMEYSLLAGEAHPAGAHSGVLPPVRRGPGGRPELCLRGGDDPYLLPDPRRPARHGRRRPAPGRPTNHKVYGEATAILAGDGLLTAAFQALAGAKLPAERVVEAVACLAKEAGPEGMVGGQALDMAGEGRALTRKELELLQSLKTGALISAAAELGCIAAGGTAEQRAAVRTYAQCLGRAFQIQDDILDVTGTAEELGKPTGSDQVNEKSTFVTALGLEESHALVHRLTDQAEAALEGFDQPEFLIQLAQSLAQRRK